MASPTWWTWVWVDSRSWWWTGRPGMLRLMGHKELDMTERLNWTELTEKLYNIRLKTSRGAFFLPPSDIYVRSFLYLFYTLINKSSEQSSLVSGPGLNSSPLEIKNPGGFCGSAATFHQHGGRYGLTEHGTAACGPLVPSPSSASLRVFPTPSPWPPRPKANARGPATTSHGLGLIRPSSKHHPLFQMAPPSFQKNWGFKAPMHSQPNPAFVAFNF